MAPSVLTMTTTSLTPAAPVDHPPAPRLVTRPLLLRLRHHARRVRQLLPAAVGGAAVRDGDAGSGAAGFATGALMVATVAGEAVTPRLVARFGYRLALAAGLILLGAPSLALIGPAGMALITAVCVVRGLGFAVMVVAGGSLTASLIPPERRGEGLALVGVVAGVPALAALPAGVWLAGRRRVPARLHRRRRRRAGRARGRTRIARPRSRARPARPGCGTSGLDPRAVGCSAGCSPRCATRRCGARRSCSPPPPTAAGVIVTFVPLLLASASGALYRDRAVRAGGRRDADPVAVGRYADRHGAAHLSSRRCSSRRRASRCWRCPAAPRWCSRAASYSAPDSVSRRTSRSA